MDTRSITELASIVASNTEKYNDYLLDEGLPLPSHNTSSSLAQGPPPPLPDHVETALVEATEASYALHQLLVGPVGRVYGAAVESNKIMCLQFIHHNNIAQKVPLDGRMTFEQIAEACELDKDDTRRMLRLAMTDNLFREPERGIVAHSATSQILAVNPLLFAWVGVTTQENWPSMLHMSEALSKWPGSEEPVETAYAIAHNINENPFDIWERDAPRAKQFGDAMNFLHSAVGFEPKHLVSGYDFTSIGQGVFVDVGGSHGYVSIAIAQTYPNIRCIVQDLPATVTSGKSRLPKEFKEQVSFMVHDFWTEQPVKDADIYYFRWIFHDWSDSYSVKILRQLIPALKNGARVLVNDICMPPPNTISRYQERWLRGIDMVMKSFSNAKERDAEEWAALFAKADARFVFLGIRMPPGSKCAIIEAEWQTRGVLDRATAGPSPEAV